MSCSDQQYQQAQTNCSQNMGAPIAWGKDTDGCCKLYDPSGQSESISYNDKASCLKGRSTGETLLYPCGSNDVGSGIPKSCYNSCENFSSRRENYVQPWTRPSAYNNLSQTWNPQKSYQL